jgi:Methyltransferase FkbM domain
MKINLLLKIFRLQLRKLSKKESLEKFFTQINPIHTEHQLIRLGSSHDGGYLVPDDFEGISACFSPGVCKKSEFEDHLASKNIKSFLADYSVDAPPINNPLFKFEKKFLGSSNDNIYMTLESWVKKEMPDDPSDFLLQMDIEGSEYDVLIASSNELLRKFRIIVIEFHDMQNLFDRFGIKVINACFSKLLRDFEIVHIHPNNNHPPAELYGYEIPPALEITFLRKDRITQRKPATKFPHPLDKKCIPHKKDYPLPICWRHK